MANLPPNTTFTILPEDDVPAIPPGRRICPTCLKPMSVWYAWKSSEHVVHYFLLCHCASRSKGKLMHFRLNSKGGLCL
jgi:hypothetical protein